MEFSCVQYYNFPTPAKTEKQEASCDLIYVEFSCVQYYNFPTPTETEKQASSKQVASVAPKIDHRSAIGILGSAKKRAQNAANSLCT